MATATLIPSPPPPPPPKLPPTVKLELTLREAVILNALMGGFRGQRPPTEEEFLSELAKYGINTNTSENSYDMTGYTVFIALFNALGYHNEKVDREDMLSAGLHPFKEQE